MSLLRQAQREIELIEQDESLTEKEKNEIIREIQREYDELTKREQDENEDYY